MNGAAQRPVVLAFAGVVVFGGLNGVGVRLSNEELDYLWGAALRFGLAAIVLLGLGVVRRVPLPRGGALIGSLLYGVVGFALAYGLLYFGLLETPASVGMVILALVPLLTLLLAVLHGLEQLRWQGLAGSLLALAGVAVIFWERIGGAAGIPLLSLLAVVGGAVAIAETGVIVKRFPRAHPLANNALAMGAGALLLLGGAVLAGQALVLPSQATTVAAVGYLTLIGSVVLFMLFLYVIERWMASATSYSLLLMPLPAAVGGALVLGEPITAGLLVGGAIILFGVYLGAFAPAAHWPWRRPQRSASHDPRPADAEPTADSADRPPSLATPGCP